MGRILLILALAFGPAGEAADLLRPLQVVGGKRVVKKKPRPIRRGSSFHSPFAAQPAEPPPIPPAAEFEENPEAPPVVNPLVTAPLSTIPTGNHDAPGVSPGSGPALRPEGTAGSDAIFSRWRDAPDARKNDIASFLFAQHQKAEAGQSPETVVVPVPGVSGPGPVRSIYTSVTRQCFVIEKGLRGSRIRNRFEAELMISGEIIPADSPRDEHLKGVPCIALFPKGSSFKDPQVKERFSNIRGICPPVRERGQSNPLLNYHHLETNHFSQFPPGLIPSTPAAQRDIEADLRIASPGTAPAGFVYMALIESSSHNPADYSTWVICQ